MLYKLITSMWSKPLLGAHVSRKACQQMELKLLFGNNHSKVVIFGCSGRFPGFKIVRLNSSLNMRNPLLHYNVRTV